MLSTRAWGWHFLSTRWGRSNEPLEIGAALGVLLYCLHLKSTPPAIVTKGIGEAIDHELARWDRLLGPLASSAFHDLAHD